MNNIYDYNYITDNNEHKFINDSNGIDMNFEFDPITKDIKIIKNEKSIQQNIVNLIMMNTYEKLFRPSIACNMRRFIFELMGDKRILQQRLEQIIAQVFNLYENRAKLLKVVYEEKPEENLLLITIWYQIIQTLVIESVDIELDIVR